MNMMKFSTTILSTIHFAKKGSLCLLLWLYALSTTTAQELQVKVFFASEIEVVDSLDPQTVTCTAYRIGDQIIYDSPQFLRLYPDQHYHLKFRFRMFNGLDPIDHLNYRDKQFKLVIQPSDPTKFKVNAITPRADGISVYGVSMGKTGDLAAFEIILTDPNGSTVGNGNFNLIIPTQELDLFYPNYMHEVPPDLRKMNKLLQAEKIRLQQDLLNNRQRW